MMNAFCKWVLVVCFGLLVSPGLLAQSDLGKISGFIKDPSGATIANAKVTIRNNTGVERQTTTNDSGYYVVTNVTPGLYTMIAAEILRTLASISPRARRISTARALPKA